MRLIVPTAEYLNAFRQAVSFFKGDFSSAIFHTDLPKIGILDRRGTKEEIFNSHFECLQDVFQGRPLLFPTFNYSFFESRVYDVANDPCEIGMLNEYARRRFSETRSLSPVFNFVVANKHDYDTGFHESPFGEASIFRQAIRKNALICMLGPGMEHSTFQHTVEEVAGDIPYRYVKDIKGKIIAPDRSFDCVFRASVPPKDPETRSMIEYRFDHLADLVEDAGGLIRRPLGRGHVVIYSARIYAEVIAARLRKDILYALTPQSQARVSRFLENLGGPMTIDNMEPGWTAE